MKKIYAIRDRVAEELVGLTMYLLFVFRTDQQAVRYFADALMDPKSILAQHPSDYELVELGTLNDSQKGAAIHSNDTYRIVITGDALVAAQTPKLVSEG